MCLSLLHFQPGAGSEPDCNCCLSNKYTYMQLRSPEVARVNFHLPVYLSLENLCFFLQVFVNPPPLFFPTVRRIVLLPCMKCAVQIKFDLMITTTLKCVTDTISSSPSTRISSRTNRIYRAEQTEPIEPIE